MIISKLLCIITIIGKQGFVQVEAFFQMLDLHEITLNQMDK